LVISWSSNISSWILSAYLRWFIYWCLFRYWYVVPPLLQVGVIPIK
jgi:hypothetical protein